MRISVKALKKEYDGQSILSGVNLDIPSGKITGVIGKSGAGKSTLIRSISLLERPESGEVYYDSERVDTLCGKDLILRRRRTGMIFQNFGLFSSRSVAQNVAYPLEIAGYPKSKISQRVPELLSLVGILDKSDSGLSQLSGGQKQRVAIARALAVNPDVLFCDEATSALDPQTTKQILSLIRSIQRQIGLTVVMITHQMEVVRDSCDYVAVLDEGVIKEFGETNSVFTQPKEKITKEFLGQMQPSDGSSVNFSKAKPEWLLKFSGQQVEIPALTRVAKLTGADFNVIRAGVNVVGDKNIGFLYTNIEGDKECVKLSVAELKKLGVIVTKLDGEAENA